LTGNSQKALKFSDGFIKMLQSPFSIDSAGGGATFVRGMTLIEAGKYSEAIQLLTKWVDISEQNSLFIYLSRCSNCLAWSYSELYDLDKAFELNKRALEIAVNLKKSPALVFSASEMRSQAEVNLMENKYEMGDFDGAWNHIEKYEENIVHPDYALMRDRWLNRMNFLKGNILIDRGELGIAEQIACQCLETATQNKWLKHVGRAERLYGEVFIRKREYEQAEDKLKSALEKFEEVGNPKQLWITCIALARLYEIINRPDLEREQWQTAAAVVNSTADDLEDEELRTTFISAKPVQEILENANR
jgi:tetratricopeptide (TPR) repeat protein